MRFFWNFKRYIDDNGVTPWLIIRIAAIVINLFLLLALVFRWITPTPEIDGLVWNEEQQKEMIYNTNVSPPQWEDPLYFPDYFLFLPALGIFLAWSSRKPLQIASVVIIAVTVFYVITTWL